MFLYKIDISKTALSRHPYTLKKHLSKLDYHVGDTRNDGMDDFDEIDELAEVVMLYHVRRARRQEEEDRVVRRRVFDRVEPTVTLNDTTFKRTFRFDKENVVWITNKLQMNLERDNRGHPLTPLQVS